MIDEAQLLFVRMRDALEELTKRFEALPTTTFITIAPGAPTARVPIDMMNVEDKNAIAVARFCIKDAAPFIDQDGRFREMDQPKAELPPNPKRFLCCRCGEVLKPYWNLYGVYTCKTATCSCRGILTTHGTEPMK